MSRDDRARFNETDRHAIAAAAVADSNRRIKRNEANSTQHVSTPASPPIDLHQPSVFWVFFRANVFIIYEKTLFTSMYRMKNNFFL